MSETARIIKERPEARRASRTPKHARGRLESRMRAVLSDGVLGTIAKEARAAECTVSAVVYEYDKKNAAVSAKTLLINDRYCDVHIARALFSSTHGKREYAHLQLSRRALEKTHAIILHVMIDGRPSRTFVIPTDVIKENYTGTRYIRMYVPLDAGPTYHNTNPRVDYGKYEDAWHAIEPLR